MTMVAGAAYLIPTMAFTRVVSFLRMDRTAAIPNGAHGQPRHQCEARHQSRLSGRRSVCGSVKRPDLGTAGLVVGGPVTR